MDAAKSISPSFEFIFKTEQEPGGGQSQTAEPGEDVVAAGAISIGEIDKLMAELQTARDYLEAEGERVRRMNARYAHLTSTASASVKIIAESMGKWRTTEMGASSGADVVMRRSHVSSLRSVHDDDAREAAPGGS